MAKNPVRFKYARALLHMPDSKWRCISCELQKILALAGLQVLEKKGYHTNCTIQRESIYSFFASICLDDPNSLYCYSRTRLNGTRIIGISG